MIYLRLKKDLDDTKYRSWDICGLYLEGEKKWLPEGDGSARCLSPESIAEYFEPQPVEEIEALHWLAQLSATAQKELSDATNAEPAQNLAPALLKNSAVEIRNLSHRLKRDLTLKQESIKRAARITMAYAEARRRELEQTIQPLKAYIEKLEEMVWTVNLYLGRDEQICSISSGAMAPAFDPMVIRQRVLAMDEEIALSHWTDFDFKKIELFDEWIKDPKNLEQVLPESKGVVVLAVRATALDYRGVDPWTGAILDRENAKTYWLCRNGENLFRIWADIQVGRLLFADGTKGVSRHEPGSEAYYQRLEGARDLEREYLRNGLVLQGLIDRTRIFHPFFDGVRPNLSDPATWKGVKFLADAENNLGEGRPSFREWLRMINCQLVDGQRVVGDFSHGCVISPQYAQGADSEEVRTVEYDRSRGFFFRFDRTDSVRKEWGYGDAERRASCLLNSSKDNWINFDRAEIEDMEFYLRSRETRLDYQIMVPLLQRCIALKHSEQSAEVPFRALLLQKLQAIVLEPEGLSKQLEELIFWWKAKNRIFRPLVGNEEHNKKAYLDILAEARRRKDEVAVHWDGLKGALPEDCVGLCARVKPSGRVVEVAVAANEHPVFVHWFVLEMEDRDWLITKKKEWCVLARGDLVGLGIIFKNAEMLQKWHVGARRDNYLSDPEVEELSAWLAQRGDIVCGTLKMYLGDIPGTEVSVDDWSIDEVDGKKSSSCYFVCFSRKNRKLSFKLRHASCRRLFHDTSGVVVWRGKKPLTLALGPINSHESIFYLNQPLLRKAVHILGKQGREETKNSDAYQYIRDAADSLLELSQQKYLERERGSYLSQGGDPEFWEDHKRTLSIPRVDCGPLFRWLEVLQEHGISPEEKTWRDIRRLALELNTEAPSICAPFPEDYEVPKGCPWARPTEATSKSLEIIHLRAYLLSYEICC